MSEVENGEAAGVAQNDASAFDPQAVLTSCPAKDLPATFGDYDLTQLKALERAEHEGSARVTVLRPLKAEIREREQRMPGLSLSQDGIALVARAAYKIGGGAGAGELDEEHLAKCMEGVLDIVTAPESPREDDYFGRAVIELVQLVAMMESLKDQLAARRPANLAAPQGQIDTSDKPAASVAKDICQLAFCSEGDTVEFSIAVRPDDFDVMDRRAVLKREVRLLPEKRRVRISSVVAMDDADRALARVKWPVPLEGGGGRNAKFPARSIALDL